MAGLDSLSNPLERIYLMNGAGSFCGYVKTDPITNNADWNVDQQYFIGDSCRSPLDGFTYVYTGGDLPAPPAAPPNQDTGPITSKRGGADPSLAEVANGGDWLRTAPLSSDVGSLAPVVTPGASWTLTGNVLTLPAAASAKYMAVVHGSLTLAAGFSAADWSTLTLTPSGTGAGAVNLTLNATTNATPVRFGQSVVFTTGTGAAPFTLTVSGASAGTAPTAVSLSVEVIRLQ